MTVHCCTDCGWPFELDGSPMGCGLEYLCEERDCHCGTCEDADHQHCWHWDTDADCERCCICDTVMED